MTHDDAASINGVPKGWNMENKMKELVDRRARSILREEWLTFSRLAIDLALKWNNRIHMCNKKDFSTYALRIILID